MLDAVRHTYFAMRVNQNDVSKDQRYYYVNRKKCLQKMRISGKT